MEKQGEAATNAVDRKETLHNDIEKMINALNKKAESITAEVQGDVVKRLIFNGVQSKGLSIEVFYKLMEERETLETYGYNINIEENIECKNLSKDSKYTIIISDNYGCYVEIKYEDYMEIVKEYGVSESAFIESQLQKLSGAGSSNLKKVSELICDILSILMYNRALFIKTYNEIGWDTYNGKDIFKYNTIYWSNSNEIKKLANILDNEKCADWIDLTLNEAVYGRCTNDDADKLFSDIEAKNKSEEDVIFARWIIDITNVMYNKPKVGIILGAACTGMIRPLVNKTKETNINMNVCGQRASGKSTICHLALSLFGDPDRLEGTFSDSDNANEIERVKRPIIPYVIDDRMLKYLENSEQSQMKSLFTSIFKEYEGKVSMRLAGAGKRYGGQRTMSPVISSSVKPLLDIFERSNIGDLGQYRRFIELNVKANELFDNAGDAEEIDKLAYEKYGFGVKLMAEYLLKDNTGTDFIRTYLDKDDDETDVNGIGLANIMFCGYVKVLGAILNDKDKSGQQLSASAQRFALILTSLQIFRLALASKMEEIKNSSDNAKKPEEINSSSDHAKKFDEVINILRDDYYISEASKVLVENLIDTMDRINYKTDALKNYKRFIADIKNKTISWVSNNGGTFKKSEHIGFFYDKKGTDLLNAKLCIIPNKGYEWLVLNYDKVPAGFDIKAYIKEMDKSFNSDAERNDKIKELTGFNIRNNAADIITDEDKAKLGYVYAPMKSYRGGAKTSVLWFNEYGIEPEEAKEVMNTLKNDSKKEGTEA